MEFAWDKKCLYCHNKEHNYKDCRKQQAKQPIVCTAQALSVRRELSRKGLNKMKIKEGLQLHSSIPETLNISKVLGKANENPALVLVDSQTQEAHLIKFKFVHL